MPMGAHASRAQTAPELEGGVFDELEGCGAASLEVELADLHTADLAKTVDVWRLHAGS